MERALNAVATFRCDVPEYLRQETKKEAKAACEFSGLAAVIATLLLAAG